MRNADNAGLTTGEDEKNLEEMMIAVGDSLSDLATSDDEEDGDDDDEKDKELRRLSNDDEPGCVVATISTMIEQYMEESQRKRMMLDELTVPE